MQVKKMLSKVPSWSLWLVFGVVVLSGVFLKSVKTYLSSINSQEVKIAEVAGLVKNPIELKGFEKEGKIRVSSFVMNNEVKFIFTKDSRVFTYNVSKGGYKDTEVEVDVGDTVKVTLSAVVDVHTLMYGYVPPNGAKCGLAPYAIIDISSYISKVEAYGEDIIDIQCWNDEETDPNPVNDFNDAVIIFSYAPQSALPSPSPSPVASPDVSPSPSPVASPDVSPSPGVSPSPSSYVVPTQPDTGTPTWLTLSLILGTLGLLSVKLKLGDEA